MAISEAYDLYGTQFNQSNVREVFRLPGACIDVDQISSRCIKITHIVGSVVLFLNDEKIIVVYFERPVKVYPKKFLRKLRQTILFLHSRLLDENPDQVLEVTDTLLV